MFHSRLPVSYYKEIAVISQSHRVFAVQHIETHRICVKKIMSVYDPAVYEQLFRSPVRNLPRIYALYEADDTLTVIEEYISGETLQELLDICGPLPEKEVLAYGVMLCDILTELHSQTPPIIHRDIKPSNIMLTEDGRLVLIDLNAARHFSPEAARDTRLLGTKGFAAPEQYGFAASSPRTDLYALGRLMQTLLAADSSSGVPVSEKADQVLKKCLRLDPADRYESAAQLKKALLKLL